MHLLASHAFWIWIISLAGIFCMLLRPWRIPEAVWISTAAILLIISRLIPTGLARRAAAEGTNVYLFLAGMMLLAALARNEGVFDWIADIAMRHSKSSARRLFLLIYAAGVIVTALLSNDATAVVLTPAVLAAVRRARVNPKPYLLACALVANAASFLLPMSNPANLVVYGNHLPPLGAWLRIFILPSITAIVVTYFCLRFLARDVLATEIGPPQDRVVLLPAGRIALAGLILAVVVLLVASALQVQLGLPTCAAAVAALIAVSVKDRAVFQRTAHKVSWSILPLVAGLFVLVESLNSAGLLRLIADSFHWLASAPTLAASFVASGGAALLSNAMNNLPVALAGGAVLKFTPQLSPAVLIGVDLGPNLSVTASLATILWLMALRREQVSITRWQFFKAGLLIMPAAWVVSILVLRF